MNENKNNLKRHIELSTKFMQMGQALISEGKESNDYNIIQAGNFFVLISGIVLDEEDIFTFSQLCSMFSAKKYLDEMNSKKPLSEENLLKDKAYQDLLSLMDDSGAKPIPPKKKKLTPKKIAAKKPSLKNTKKKKDDDSSK